jgi:ABC-2 type transport system ATP-binding protein
MSIVVSGVTKNYGQQKALDDVSFEVKSGEIVGFLGPNGAGKSTMMKIITCFIPPTKGKIEVCGFDVLDDSINVRKRVGYLPEHNPLYLDMYVKEYLSFVAGLHRVKKKKDRVKDMIGIVGLELEQNKKIGALSKGYRQRVGLAQSLIHDPEVLILDEPTNGFDPNQLEDVRKLIREIGKSKTVMLSTHIMQEVNAMCDRIIIVKRGKIVADDKKGQIQTQAEEKQVIKVEFDKEVAGNRLKSITGVQRVKNTGNNTWVIESKSSKDLRPEIAKFAQDNGLLVLAMQKEEQNLEDVFKKLTRK